jgi:hypothetical protein
LSIVGIWLLDFLFSTCFLLLAWVVEGFFVLLIVLAPASVDTSFVFSVSIVFLNTFSVVSIDDGVTSLGEEEVGGLS